VHFHGFPNAAAVFDGVPESSIVINMGFSFTYYYKIVEPGTFMYHCHVEATEHMAMGMLGNLYVQPAQNGTPMTHNGVTYTNFVYNDGDGSTGYDTGVVDGVPDQPLEFPIQIAAFDSNFHREHLAVQPLPFAEMRDDYPMLNGRGYPDTMRQEPVPVAQGEDAEKINSGVTSAEESSQKVHTIIRAPSGKKILLRISNLNVTKFFTLATTGGLQMQVVGTGAHILRGPGGTDLYYKTGSVTLGGGEAVDVLIDTAGVAPGRYLLYSTNLNELSNGPEDFGGMMTEIIIE
jgi:FtsP/CotA-like multicopper oxidase with cupredoxin domain